MGRTTCAVKGCPSSKDGVSSISFYRIYAGSRDADEWIKFCCNPSVGKFGMICSLHFKNSDFNNPNNKAQGLRYFARPSLFPATEQEPEIGIEERFYLCDGINIAGGNQPSSEVFVIKDENGLQSYVVSHKIVVNECEYEPPAECDMDVYKQVKIKDETLDPEEGNSAGHYSMIRVKEEIEPSDCDKDTTAYTRDEVIPAEINKETHDAMINLTEAVEVKQEFIIDEVKGGESSELEKEVEANESDEYTLLEIEDNPSDQDTPIDIKMESHDTDNESDLSIEDLTETVEIKQELTLEEPKVEKYSELEQKKLKMSCKFCDFRCVTKKDFWTHVRAAHPEERMTRCSICRVQFKGTKPLEKHIADEHQGLEFECRICLVQLKKDQVAKHKKKCPGRLLYRCETCDKSYVKKEALLKHFEEHYESEDQQDVSTCETRIQEQFFSCDICEDERAYRKDPFWEHVKDQHDGHFVRCPDCRKTFTSHRVRFAHMKKQCKVGSARERFVAEQQKCPQCPKSFGSIAALDNHKIRYHSRRPSRCVVCNLEFSSSSTLRYHRIKTHSELSLKCPYCEQKFHFDYTLRRHVALHQNERQILCDKCGRGFNSHSQLASHALTHTNEAADSKKRQIFKCEKCRKKFRLRANYEKHVRLHD